MIASITEEGRQMCAGVLVGTDIPCTLKAALTAQDGRWYCRYHHPVSRAARLERYARLYAASPKWPEWTRPIVAEWAAPGTVFDR